MIDIHVVSSQGSALESSCTESVTRQSKIPYGEVVLNDDSYSIYVEQR